MRKLLVIVMILLQAFALPAAEFAYHVFELRTEAEFSDGVFPASVVYQFDFPVKDLIEGSTTVVAARLDAGLDPRTLRQDPDDGSFYALDPDSVDFDLDYLAMYGEINLYIDQGFMHKERSDKDLFRLFASLDVRFEHAYDKLEWMSDSDHLDALFNYVVDGVKYYRFSGSSWTGAPELKGKRQNNTVSLSFAFTVDYLRETVTERDGVMFKSWLRWAPDFIPLSTGYSDFLASYNTLTVSKTLLSKDNKAWSEGLTWVSLVLDEEITYRYIWGDKVPAYIQGGELWEDAIVPNLRHVFTSMTTLTLYGPQLGVPDLYPDISLFIGLGWGLGKALNSKSSERYTEFVSCYGLRGELVLFNICEFFVEVGCVLDPAFNEEHYVKGRAGFQFGI